MLLFLLPLMAFPNAAQPSAFRIDEKLFPADDNGPAVTVQRMFNPSTGESVEVLQSYGGKLERVALCRRQTASDGNATDACETAVRDVISSRCDSLGSCNSSTLRGESSLGALLIPFANRIAYGRYNFGGVEHELSSDNSTVSHGFLIKGRPMRVVSKSTTSSSATLVLGVVSRH
eukprot:SAG31_NODE_4575_length_3124_cov_2.054545_3_plen_175_part_00